MPPAIEPTMSVLIKIVTDLPIGTNLAMLHFMWMLVGGLLLPHRGTLFPALQSTGLDEQAVRRAWAAFYGGMWQIGELMAAWEKYMQEQQRWQPRRYEGYYACAFTLKTPVKPLSKRNCSNRFVISCNRWRLCWLMLALR